MSRSGDQEVMPSRSALRRMREKEQKYSTILKAAETLFARKGYHQTGIEEIADLAEVSTGAVYIYFKNKEDLLITLMQEIGHQLRIMLADEFKRTGFSLDSFKNISFAFIRNFCGSHPEWIAIFFRESVGQSGLVEEHRKLIWLPCAYSGCTSELPAIISCGRTGRGISMPWPGDPYRSCSEGLTTCSEIDDYY